MLAVGSQRADAANLDGDGREIGETAQGVSGDQYRFIGKHCLHFPEVQVSNELVDHQLLPDQPSDGDDILGGHPDQPGDWGQQVAEDQLQGQLLPDQPIDTGHAAQALENIIDHRDQGDEGEQHRRHVEGQLQAVGRAIGGGFDHIGGGFFHMDLNRTFGGRRFGLRDQDLGDHHGGRRRHDAGGEQVLGVVGLGGQIGPPQNTDIGGQHPSGDGGHAPDHQSQQFRMGHFGDEGAHYQRRFGLTDKHVGRHREGFRSADPHGLGHHPGHPLHHPLHDAQVVEHRHQRGEEDNGGQHLEGEDEPESLRLQVFRKCFGKVALGGQRVKHEAGAVGGKADDDDKKFTHPFKYLAAVGGLQHQQSKKHLQPQAGGHQAPVDPAAVIRKQNGDADQRRQTQYCKKDIPDHLGSASSRQ